MIIQSAAVLEAVKARPGNAGVRLYGGATADLDSLSRVGVRNHGRGGRKPAARSNKRKHRSKKESGLRRRVGLDNVPLI
jgi:hypothetical protein